MRKSMIALTMLAVLLAGAATQAKELILIPAKVETIVSPSNARDTRVLLYFELPGELMSGKARIVSAALLFKAGIEDANFGLVHVFPVTKAWQGEASVGWGSPWETPGGDYTQRVAGKSVTLKASKGTGEVASNVTFIVMDWVSGRLANNGLVVVPSQEDLAESAAKVGLDKTSVKLRVVTAD